jgi:hypothetical protein
MIQLSIEVDDKPGELAKIIGVIAENRIDMKALYLGESPRSSGIGLVKIIVTDYAEANKKLSLAGFKPVEERVIVTALEDHPGGLYSILQILSKQELNIKHVYSFVSRIEGKALSVFGFEQPDKAIKALQDAGVHIIERSRDVPSPHMPHEPDLSDYVGGVFYW